MFRLGGDFGPLDCRVTLFLPDVAALSWRGAAKFSGSLKATALDPNARLFMALEIVSPVNLLVIEPLFGDTISCYGLL